MVQLLLAVIYLSYISLGLPDAALGSAWPVMYGELGVPISSMGIISMIISAGTIVSSLLSDRLNRKLGTGLVTLFSVALTALALLGFSLSHSFWLLCLIAIPYGLGAGSVDAALNGYVALHYASRHMSWLHCMWGIGAAAGPYLMGYALTGGVGWNSGYRYIAILQFALTAILLLSLPLWKKTLPAAESSGGGQAIPLGRLLRLPGVPAAMLCFFCYCALEQCAGQWASSYLVLHKGVPEETAASYASMFYLGITGGRALSGFLTIKFNDRKMIHMGELILLLGVGAMLLPLGQTVSLVGLLLIGLGCAPVYPCIMHSIPEFFGAERSQAVMGLQTASASVGVLVMPPLFGLVANDIGVRWLPTVLLLILLLLGLSYERLCRRAGNHCGAAQSL